MLDQILTEHPEVEFMQIIVNYFDWNSYFYNHMLMCCLQHKLRIWMKANNSRINV